MTVPLKNLGVTSKDCIDEVWVPAKTHMVACTRAPGPNGHGRATVGVR